MSNEKQVITDKDIKRAYLRWWLSAETSANYERMQGLSWCASLAPILQKLYPKKEDLVSALKRHAAFFNTQAMWGSLIFGSTIALEEQKASSGTIPDEMITSYKTGLMGPVAGLGDTIDYATIFTIMSAIFCSIATETGSIVAPLLMLLFSIFHFFEGYFFNQIGYKTGRSSIQKIMKSGVLKEAVTGATIMGFMMMGSLSSSLVRVQTVFETEGFNLQETLDGIAPGILQIILVFIIYGLMKRKQITPAKIVVGIIVVSVLLSLIGVL
ncbi:PTS system mannose/fructose/sorbose family transporter subunit IID [Enterococcus sp. 669A]|uniref:PTS system mannose/fructose/sorbose family transporter subunit IID n=1 Tax=Candidatus Enterococcus moelleringii TaxID=2815325 RepID=A0ABS3L9I0_9ENTE|nr:PTS system mannose/fructose/sorbose family transporter subunit IID [Enterococcus sp. 669A]MBO1306282.1 PTS system mannose/fructose/sorbose family transporter subunit IID [Enterococcus sp. 669A]